MGRAAFRNHSWKSEKLGFLPVLLLVQSKPASLIKDPFSEENVQLGKA